MTLPVLDLHLNGTGVMAQRDLMEGIYLVFRADSIREAPTGTHARLEICLGAVTLAWTTCNVERDEDRLRLANRATRLLPKESRGDYLPDYLKHDLDYFCRHLWETFLSGLQPVEAPGLPDWEPQFLLNPYVLREGGTIIFAPPGAGKSYLSLLMVQSVNTGSSALWPVTKVPGLYLNLERSHISVRARLAKVNRVLGLAPDTHLAMLPARGRSLISLVPMLQRYIETHSIGFGVLDSISRTGAGGLIGPEDVNPIIDTLARLFPTWLAIAHTPRATGEHAWGGVMWDAGADVMLMLKSQLNADTPSKLGLSLQVTKANDISIPPLALWELDFSGGLTVSKGHARDYPDLAFGRKMSPTEQIADYLLEVGKAHAGTIATALKMDRSNVSKCLKSSRRFERLTERGPHQEVFFSVKEALAGG